MKQNLDHWELEYIKNMQSIDDMPFTDEDAYKTFRAHNWIYDKYELLIRLDQPVWNLDHELPPNFPVFVKPRFNFDGMGKGAFVAHSRKDLERPWLGKGFIAQPLYQGQHESVDYVIHEGTLIDSSAFLGHKNARNAFLYFESYPHARMSPLTSLMTSSGYNGFLNVEYIDGQVIEAHLRPSMQFYDIDGGLIRRYLEQRHHITKTQYVKSSCQYAYSIVIPVYRNMRPEFQNVKDLPETVRSVQYCWEPGKYLSDSSQHPDNFRLLVVNGTDLQTAYDFGEGLRHLILSKSENDETFGRKRE